MPSALIKWLTCIAFGALVTWASFGVLGPVLQRLFGLENHTGLAYMAALDRMLITTTVVALVTGMVLVAALARIPNFRRRLGWGCAVLGLTLLLTLVTAAFSMEPGIFNPASGGKQAANDAYTALFFWALIFGLPYLAGGLALTIGGWVLIRRNPGPGAVRPA